ncbi:aldehyde dehydrogenase family protein [Paenibacillus sp. CC-CFT747]|nr:aldehyde dehydrogenase family protein [Paenibacillus sp. CC-CFT747]
MGGRSRFSLVPANGPDRRDSRNEGHAGGDVRSRASGYDLPGGGEAVRLANAVPYGLSASVFTKDRKRALRLARELETGSCSINNVIVPVSDVRLPFGGMKGSGFGRIRGREGLLAFCRTKTITRERGLAKSAVNWFPYRETAFPYMKAWLSRWYG